LAHAQRPFSLIHILISGSVSVNQARRRTSQAIQWFEVMPTCKDVS
jgi:hypothetical protein